VQRSPAISGNKLRKEIVITLIVKGLFLYLLWFLFFQEPDQPLPANQQFEQHLFGQAQSPTANPNSVSTLNKEP